MNIVLLGAPGAGKGTQAAKIQEAYGVKHISTGDIFRKNIKEQTKIGKVAQSYIQKGQLVPDDVTCKIVELALEEIGNENFMLDGFPRNLFQAEALDKLVRIDKVIDISVDLGALTERICGRRSCTKCGYLTHVSALGGQTTCPKCGGELMQRADDQEETVKSRLAVYNDQTAPLIEYYSERGKLVSVDGMGKPDDVFEEIKKVL